MSGVTCNMSFDTCHLSHVMCHVVKLVGGCYQRDIPSLVFCWWPYPVLSPSLAGSLGFAQISYTAKYGEELSSRGPGIEPLPVWPAIDNVQWVEGQGKGAKKNVFWGAEQWGFNKDSFFFLSQYILEQNILTNADTNILLKNRLIDIFTWVCNWKSEDILLKKDNIVSFFSDVCYKIQIQTFVTKSKS